jgi:hypothetical protein
LIVIIIGTAVYTFRESLDLPVAPKRNIKRKKAKVAKSKARQPKLLQRAKSVRGKSRKGKNSRTEDAEIIDDLDRPRRPVRVPHQSELPEWEPPRDDSGLIMLEID